MDLQYLIVIGVIALAAAFSTRTIYNRSRQFNSADGCGTDCGCSAGAENKN